MQRNPNDVALREEIADYYRVKITSVNRKLAQIRGICGIPPYGIIFWRDVFLFDEKVRQAQAPVAPAKSEWDIKAEKIGFDRRKIYKGFAHITRLSNPAADLIIKSEGDKYYMALISSDGWSAEGKELWKEINEDLFWHTIEWELQTVPTLTWNCYSSLI